VNELAAGSRAWTWPGLAIALLGLPIAVGSVAALLGPLDAWTIVARECLCFALAAVLVLAILPREGLGWASIGLDRPKARELAKWVPLAALASFAAAGAGVLLGVSLGLRFAGSDASLYDRVPTAVFLLVILRAGLVEELFYRAYAIDRLERITGSRLVAVAAPLIFFALFHYKQRAGGMLVALFAGAALTAIWLHKRNLWINASAHFLVDFVPNVLLPLLLPSD